jgi:hypothetical protein
MDLFRWLEGRAKMRRTVNTSVIIRRGGPEYNSMRGVSAMRILIANDDGIYNADVEAWKPERAKPGPQGSKL